MYAIKTLVLAALIACAAACSTLPPSMAVRPTDVQKLNWTKSAEVDAFRDQHGVCQLFARDARAALQGLGRQVRACFDGTLPEKRVPGPQARSVEVAWNKVPRAEMARVYADATGQGTSRHNGGGWRSADALNSVRGFFVYQGDTCHVVVPDDPGYVPTLGHEFKHCVDGYFHDNRGEWQADADSAH